MRILKSSKNSIKHRIVAISAGGTGGHIFPALSIAELLIKDGYFVYFFSDKKFFNYIKDNDVIFSCGMFQFIELTARNSSRIKQFWMILKDLWISRLILTENVSLCIGFGGFVSFAPLLFGILTFKKTIIHEQNSVIGLANRMLLPFVKRCLLTFEETKGVKSRYLKKCIFVGNPIREKIKKFVYYYDNPSVNYRAFYKIDDIINLTIVGGSQACQVFDNIIPKAIAKLPNTISNKLFVHQQCKISDVSMLEDFYTQNGISHDVRPFFHDIGALFRESHLVISRAGSTTISEISALGVPSILIPLPTSANNHQYENAKFLRDHNGAVLIEENNLTAENLSLLLTDLFTHDYMLFELSQSCRKIAIINADLKILSIISEILHNKSEILQSLVEKNDFNKKVSYINDNIGLG